MAEVANGFQPGETGNMTTPIDPIAAETHELYLHLLNLKQATGEAATDPVALHRDIANAPEGKDAHVDPAALQRIITPSIPASGARAGSRCARASSTRTPAFPITSCITSRSAEAGRTGGEAGG